MSSVLRIAAVGLVLALAGCGQISQRSGSRASYTVVAPLLGTPGHQIFACYTTLSSLPPAGCGGVEVTNVDVSAIPGGSNYGSLVQTPRVTLVGVWDGHTLTLTEPPSPNPTKATEPKTVPLPTFIATKGAPDQVEAQIAADMKKLQA